MTSAIYEVVFGAAETRPGIAWINRPQLIEGRFPRGPHKHPEGLWSEEGSGFPTDMKRPQFVLAGDAGRRELMDVESLGLNFSLVSDAAKVEFERLDKSAFAFLGVDLKQADGSPYHGATHWLCDVVRFLDAVDDEKSAIKPYFVSGVRFTKFPLFRDAIFLPRVLEGRHVFRLMYRPAFVGCDDAFRDAVEVRLTGFDFHRVGRIDG